MSHGDRQPLGAKLLGERLRAGDTVLMDPRSALLLEKLPRPEVEELVLEEVPDIAYESIGGLGNQIEAIRDAVHGYFERLQAEGVADGFTRIHEAEVTDHTSGDSRNLTREAECCVQ